MNSVFDSLPCHSILFGSTESSVINPSIRFVVRRQPRPELLCSSAATRRLSGQNVCLQLGMVEVQLFAAGMHSVLRSGAARLNTLRSWPDPRAAQSAHATVQHRQNAAAPPQ